MANARTNRIHLRFSELERNTLERIAKARNVTVTELIRRTFNLKK